jgi:hypothetical protein
MISLESSSGPFKDVVYTPAMHSFRLYSPSKVCVNLNDADCAIVRVSDGEFRAVCLREGLLALGSCGDMCGSISRKLPDTTVAMPLDFSCMQSSAAAYVAVVARGSEQHSNVPLVSHSNGLPLIILLLFVVICIGSFHFR